MKQLLSILLLAVFGLPLVAPLFALAADGGAGLPACCRRNGKHHCMMSMPDNSLTPRGPAFSSIPEKCPYRSGTMTATHPNVLAAPAAESIFASLVSHPAGIAQTASMGRISRDRSRQKRGPPQDSL